MFYVKIFLTREVPPAGYRAAVLTYAYADERLALCRITAELMLREGFDVVRFERLADDDATVQETEFRIEPSRPS